MRLIDENALTKRFVEFCNKNCPYTAKERNVMCGSCFMGLALEAVEDAPTIESQEIIRCKDCKYRMPYDWMFSEIWRSQNIDDYSEDEIGCQYCDMAMKADDFCSRAERRTDEQ